MRHLRDVPVGARPVLPALAAVLMLVSGCGSGHPAASSGPGSAAPSASHPTPSPSSTATPPTAPPAKGAQVTGTGYRLRLPKGWRDVTSKLKTDTGIDRAAGAVQSVHGFRSNFNVVVTDGSLTMAQLPTVTANIRQRMLSTAPKYAVLPQTRIAGSPAGHLAGLRSEVNKPYWIDQYVVLGPDHCYIISFSFSPKVPTHQRQHTIDSVLTSWSWSH
ncbi:hypothetical protein [Nocardioides terrisoli]|uniref:hypothetical protein n=1 Tax=Nocardioides terrisoli TaxID=3388267 RepID=UPI00287B8017|nr:hypothetical protein [Nocardioides marmorisolisilvae]